MTATTDGEDRMTTPAPDQGNLVQRVVRWLREGYPEGVPQQDYVALLGILRRSLTDGELAQVVEELTQEVEAGQQILTRQLVEQRIEDVVKGPIDQRDAVRVSARLAAAGWPLGSPLQADVEEQDDADPERPGLVGRVVDWLRSGYPTGLPDQDYVPLVALLRRRLSDHELRAVSRHLADSGTLSTNRVDIGTAIAKVTSELPSVDDIERVRRYLGEPPT
ncbi:MAG: hypothetical protein JWR90_1114 [Marmoricola sp.]|jgi:hypothetical protein|nr:hypothetical protein [Marmoricola sp.]